MLNGYKLKNLCIECRKTRKIGVLLLVCVWLAVEFSERKIPISQSAMNSV